MKKIFNWKVVAFIILTITFVMPGFSQINADNESKAKTNLSKIESNKKEDLSIVKTEKDTELDNEIKKKEISQENEKAVSKGSNLFSTVKQGGLLMIALLLLALGAMTIIIERLIFFTRNKVWDNNYVEEFLIKASKESKVKFKEDLEDELRGIFQLYSNGMERGLALLSGVGNLSPVVGFLGTVIGMISAFASIAAATTVNAKVVAVGIQMALVTTAGGLLVAAPALAFYYFFAHIIHSKFAAAENIIAVECDNLPRLSSALNNEEENKNNE